MIMKSKRKGEERHGITAAGERTIKTMKKK